MLSTRLFLAPDLYCGKLFAFGVAVVLDYHILLSGSLSVIFLRLVAESKTKIITLFNTHIYIVHIFERFSLSFQSALSHQITFVLRNLLGSFKDKSLEKRDHEVLMNREQ